MIADLFAIIAPVFVCAAIGYGWARRDLPFDNAFATTLVSNVAFPCLILGTLARLELSPDAFSRMAWATLATVVVSGAAAAFFVGVARQSQRVFLPPLVFGNTGNVGLPLCLFAFGEEGLVLGIIYFAVFLVIQFTAGIWVVSGRMSFPMLLRTPVLWAALLGVALQFTGIHLPVWIDNTVGLLGDIAIPLMLLALGVSLAKLVVTGVGRSVAMSLARLGIGFGVGAAIAGLFGLEGPARGVLILESSMPVAVVNYLFAERYGSNAEEVAGLVVISTALSFLTLPLLLRFLL